MKKALVILSGGQDSTTCLFMALRQLYDVHAITFNYNQTHTAELQCARDVGKLAGVKSHEFVHLGSVLKSTSPLIDPQQTLENYESFEQMDAIIGDRIEKTFVPMRNALFLTIAANHAVALDCDMLITGVCQADNANYPDCREDFIGAMTQMINHALGYRDQYKFQIGTPLMHLTKAQSIQKAIEANAYYALAFTHTAYDGRYPPTSKDHASVLRAQGFFEAGHPDPLVIRAVEEGLMPLPEGSNYQDHALNSIVVDGIRKLQQRLRDIDFNEQQHWATTAPDQGI